MSRNVTKGFMDDVDIITQAIIMLIMMMPRDSVLQRRSGFQWRLRL